MKQKSYRPPTPAGSGRIDASGLLFVAGLVIVAVVLTFALGISANPDMPPV